MQASILLHQDRLEFLDIFTDEQVGQIMRAIFEFQFSGAVVSFEDKAMHQTYRLLVQNVEQNNAYRDSKSKAGKASGKSRRDKNEQTGTHLNTSIPVQECSNKENPVQGCSPSLNKREPSYSYSYSYPKENIKEKKLFTEAKEVNQKYASVGKHALSKNTKKKRIIMISLAILLIVSVSIAYYQGTLPKFNDLFPGADSSQSKVVSYTDTCKCPNYIAADGSKCGKRGAWSRGQMLYAMMRADKF